YLRTRGVRHFNAPAHGDLNAPMATPAIRLAPLPLRVPFVDEGVDAFVHVLRHHVARHDIRRELVGGIQRHAALTVEHGFTGTDGHRALAPDLGYQRLHSGVQFVGRHGLI